MSDGFDNTDGSKFAKNAFAFPFIIIKNFGFCTLLFLVVGCSGSKVDRAVEGDTKMQICLKDGLSGYGISYVDSLYATKRDGVVAGYIMNFQGDEVVNKTPGANRGNWALVTAIPNAKEISLMLSTRSVWTSEDLKAAPTDRNSVAYRELYLEVRERKLEQVGRYFLLRQPDGYNKADRFLFIYKEWLYIVQSPSGFSEFAQRRIELALDALVKVSQTCQK